MRREDGCLNCGEVREIAAYGLCFRCYRRKDRAKDRQFAAVDHHNPGLRKEHQKLLRGFTSVMVGFSNLGVSKSDVWRFAKPSNPISLRLPAFLLRRPAKMKSRVQ